jgi:hypothetical protein
MKIILRFNRLGIDDQQNGLHEFLILLRVIYFLWIGPRRKSDDQKPKTFPKLEQQIRDILATLPLDF